jgi:hypothetical protein
MGRILDHRSVASGNRLGPVRVTQSRNRLLGAILVLGLVGHLWMQTAHTLPSGSHDDDSRVAASAHDRRADHPHEQPADHHPQQCAALESGDQPRNNPPRTAATAPGARPHVVVSGPITAVRAFPAADLQPRAPSHGVVLLL